jgi:4-amino-4-deoxy-L-arabinose transferase-like glycosyltransferase
MKANKTILKSEIFFLIVISLLTTYLGFRGLGNNSLWDDEAQVAIFAQNILKTGELVAWDGRNLFSYRNGNVLDTNLRIINSPMHYYNTALFYKIFGFSTWAGRFPSVIFGIASLFVFWPLLRNEFPKRRPLRLYALTLVAFSYSFLLNIRQATYYAPAIFFALLTYYLFKRCVNDKQNRWFLLLAGSFLCMFFVHYLLCAALIGGIGLVFLCFYLKQTRRSEWLKFGLASIVFSVIVVPYIFVFEVWVRHEVNGNVSLFSKTLILFYQNIRELDLIGYMPGSIVLMAVLLGLINRKQRVFPRAMFEWCVLSFGYIVTLSFFSIQPPVWLGWSGSLADIRYLVVLIPFSAGIVASVIVVLHRYRYGPYIGCTLMAVIICTNILSFKIVDQRFRWLLPAFINEIHNDYDTPYDAVITYLKNNAKKDDIVYVYPEHNLNPIQAYLGDTLKMQGLLRRNTLLPKEKLKKLNGLVFIDESFPDWIVAFGLRDMDRVLGYFSSGPFTYACKSNDERCNTIRLNIFGSDMTRPELPWHDFSPVNRFNLNDAIYIFKKNKFTQSNSCSDKEKWRVTEPRLDWLTGVQPLYHPLSAIPAYIDVAKSH